MRGKKKNSESPWRFSFELFQILLDVLLTCKDFSKLLKSFFRLKLF